TILPLLPLLHMVIILYLLILCLPNPKKKSGPNQRSSQLNKSPPPLKNDYASSSDDPRTPINPKLPPYPENAYVTPSGEKRVRLHMTPTARKANTTPKYKPTKFPKRHQPQSDETTTQCSQTRRTVSNPHTKTPSNDLKSPEGSNSDKDGDKSDPKETKKREDDEGGVIDRGSNGRDDDWMRRRYGRERTKDDNRERPVYRIDIRRAEQRTIEVEQKEGHEEMLQREEQRRLEEEKKKRRKKRKEKKKKSK
ncbi:hypothetical protein PFISCL1PPCAC_6733, partial [Pristionchus fissidentatus]